MPSYGGTAYYKFEHSLQVYSLQEYYTTRKNDKSTLRDTNPDKSGYITE